MFAAGQHGTHTHCPLSLDPHWPRGVVAIPAQVDAGQNAILTAALQTRSAARSPALALGRSSGGGFGGLAAIGMELPEGAQPLPLSIQPLVTGGTDALGSAPLQLTALPGALPEAHARTAGGWKRPAARWAPVWAAPRARDPGLGGPGPAWGVRALAGV